jgi:proteasome lid subunit RPN8/RPN11/DNA-directed RNA polymerase subunit RPC12/RpoP
VLDLSSSGTTWRDSHCPFLIECTFTVLNQIRQDVEEGLDTTRRGQEVGGVLFGIQEPGRIRILAYKPLQCEHALGPGFVLSEKDEGRLSRMISATGAPELDGLQPLGWYHSHIRSRIFLSERDRQIHTRYFGAPFQVALVIHPKLGRPARAGFFFRELSGNMRTDSSYEEFTIESPASERSEVKQAFVSGRAPYQRETSNKKAPSPHPEVTCPRCGSAQLRRSRRASPVERFRAIFGYSPYRCHECLSRSFLKTSEDLLQRVRSNQPRRREQRKRALRRTRREVLLWGGGALCFLAILYYLTRDSGPKSDGP